MKKFTHSDVKVGDWVAFRMGGRTMVGRVDYKQRDFLGARIHTDQGTITADEILELRAALRENEDSVPDGTQPEEVKP